VIRKLGHAFVAFWRTLRSKQAQPGTLREFVYLDETSVESLLASLDGEVLTGVTESKTRGFQLGVAATGDAVGVPTGLSPSLNRSRSVTVEEQRKSVAQSAFARFRSRHYRNLRLRAPDRGQPGAEDVDVAIASLRRGDLIEIDATLGASEVFQVRAVIDSMMGVVGAYPELMGATEMAAIKAAAPIGDLLGSLSQGLIPIEGVVADLRAVSKDDFEAIVSVDVADRMRGEGATVRDVIVAGVSIEPLYWQDVRRVLFSNQKFRVLGRLVNDGARNSWSSLKITEVLSRVNMQIAATIDSFGPMFLATLRQEADSGSTAVPVESAAQETLRKYVQAVAELSNVVLAPELDFELSQHIEKSASTPMSADQWMVVQKTIAEQILAVAGHRLEPEVMLELRGRFPRPSATASSERNFVKRSIENETGPIYLEMEIIAIYW
jgi:hypothetical protein